MSRNLIQSIFLGIAFSPRFSQVMLTSIQDWGLGFLGWMIVFGVFGAFVLTEVSVPILLIIGGFGIAD